MTFHSFAEGVGIGVSFGGSGELAIFITAAIAVHNIPEGIATSLPMYAAGSSRRSAVGLALASGLVEPLGALLAGIFLTAFHDLVPFGLAFASGVMVFITMDELIPVAHEQGHEHFISLGLITGCIATFILIGTLG
jgi:ZIP family zinc transporter